MGRMSKNVKNVITSIVVFIAKMFLEEGSLEPKTNLIKIRPKQIPKVFKLKKRKYIK